MSRELLKNILKYINPKKLILAIVVLIVSALGMFYFSDYPSENIYSVSGIDVLTDCDTEIDATVMIQPMFNSGVSSILISINNFDSIKDKCTFMKFILPLNTPDVLFYMLPSNSFDEESMYVELPKNLTSISPLGYRSVDINLKSMPEFTGNIYTVVKNINKKSFSQSELFLQFYASKVDAIKLDNSIQNFKVSMPLDNSYKIIPNNTKVTAQKVLLNQSVYWFDINKLNPILNILIENESLNKWKNLFFNIFVVILGIAIALFIGAIKKNKNRYRDRDAHH